MKRLKDLFINTGEALPGNLKSVEINRIQYDSRKIQKGDLFVAIKGFQTDGHAYLEQAYEKGAIAAVVEEQNKDIVIPQIKVKNSRAILAEVAYNFYAPYLEKLVLIGITGTNGKTTTSYLVRSILNSSGMSCGLVGTIHYIIGSRAVDAWNTTPESVDLYEMLAEMQTTGNKACVLEVSSHALALKRVLGLKFNAAVFTNLSRDHMDFHPDMESYFNDKSLLFNQINSEKGAVINNDDLYGKRLIQKLPEAVRFGNKPENTVFPVKQKISEKGTIMSISTPTGTFDITSGLIGDFNISNILAAVGVGISLGLSLEQIKLGLENLNAVPGRLETYPLKNGALAVIDYAHTPDALEKALKTVKKITHNKLRVIFGCGGDRDRGKRPEMGKVAQSLADIVYITDDNPRTENPQNIINDILKGINRNENVHIVYNRRDAIHLAISDSEKGDVILIAGKGHEKYQIIGKVKHDFDEVAIIREAETNA